MVGSDMKKILVSACLLGINCTYCGKNSLSLNVLQLTKDFFLIPICPEQLGGLPTPRPRAEIVSSKGWHEGARVIDEYGKDVTGYFIKGARESLKIAKLMGAQIAILKSKSPSCGTHYVYDGTFKSVLVPGTGCTAWYLRTHGVEVFSEEELDFLTYSQIL